MASEPPELPPPDQRPISRREAGGIRSGAKWILGALLAFDVAVLLVVLALANVTQEGPAKRSLRHAVAILTEVDGFLDDQYEAFRLEADQADGALTLPDFPIELAFTPGEVLAGDRDEFRELLLTRAADRVHSEGVAAMRDGGDGGISFFSTEGAVRTGMDFLRPTPHRVLTMLTIALATAAGVLALLLALALRGYGRLLGVGLSLLLASLPFLVTAVALRFALRVAADGVDDYLAREAPELGQELVWAAIRNGIIFSTGGAMIVAMAAVLARWSDSARRV